MDKPLSYSGVKSILTSTGDYWKKHILGVKKTTPAMVEGKIFHACLTGDWRDLSLLPEDHNNRTKAGKSLIESIEKEGKVPVDRSSFLKWMKITRRIRKSDLLKGCEFEKLVEEKLFKYPFKGYIDAIDHEKKIIYDFKSFSLGTATNVEDAILRSAKRFNYFLQMFIYGELIRKIEKGKYRTVLLFVRTDEFLNTCHPYEIEFDEMPELKAKVKSEIQEAISRTRKCQKNNNWLEDGILEYFYTEDLGSYYLEKRT